MSDLSNPLFDNQREFLERQKEEYKSALMGDVEQIKSQSQEIGKKVAIAGGVLVAGYLVKRLFSGGKKKTEKLSKAEKAKKKSEPLHVSHSTGSQTYAGVAGYDELLHEQGDAYSHSSGRVPPASAHQHSTGTVAKSFMNSELVQVLTHQLAALLMVYLTKKVEEYLSSVSKNDDIATRQPIEVTEIETTEYIYPEKDAL